MYGKFHDTCFTGSMMGAGDHVFAVWGFIIANAVDSQVEVNPKHVASLIGMKTEEVSKALAFLEAPDPESRNPKNEGRRIVHLSGFSYHVSNHAEYRDLRDQAARREYFAMKQREHRARVKAKCQTMSNDVNDVKECQAQAISSTQEAEAEAEASTTPTPSKGLLLVDFEKFWSEIHKDNRIAKGRTREAWLKAIKGGASSEQILGAVDSFKRYERKRRQQTDYKPLHPSTWLNQGRFEDDEVQEEENGNGENWINQSIYS